LTLLGSLGRSLGLNQKHIDGYAFLFLTPWGWLIDRIWFTTSLHWVNQVVSYVLALWIPAFLYCLSLWGLLRGINTVALRTSRRSHG
jgi:hypothetical protein